MTALRPLSPHRRTTYPPCSCFVASVHPDCCPDSENSRGEPASGKRRGAGGVAGEREGGSGRTSFSVLELGQSVLSPFFKSGACDSVRRPIPVARLDVG